MKLRISSLFILNIFFLLSILFLDYINDFWVIVLLLFSYILSVGTVYGNRRVLFTDFYFVFLSLFFLYGFVNPLVEYVLSSKLLPHTKISVILYQMSLSSLTIGYVLNKKSWNSRARAKAETMNGSRYVIVLFLLALGIVGYKAYVVFSMVSYSALFDGGVVSRLDGITQSWIVLGYLLIGIYLYVIYNYKNISSILLVLFLIVFIAFAFSQLSVGSRRDFLPIIIAAFWMYSYRNESRVTLFKLFLLTILVFIFLIFSSMRLGLGSMEAIVLDALQSNEFVYPFYTLSLTVEKGSVEYLYGFSFLLLPVLFFIPRGLYEEKPISLANMFVNEHIGEGGMGYAYTLVTESYMNFYYFGPFIFFVLCGFFIKKFSIYNDRRVIFILYSMIPDICRGEFSSLTYQFFFFSFFLLVMPVCLNFVKKFC